MKKLYQRLEELETLRAKRDDLEREVTRLEYELLIIDSNLLETLDEIEECEELIKASDSSVQGTRRGES